MDLHDTVETSGIVQQFTTVTMSSSIESRVLTVPVDLGVIVQPQDLLVQLDDRLFAANLERAKADAAHAEELHRMELLESKGWGQR